MLEVELQRTKKEADDFAKQTKQSENDASSRDIKLNRALEEVEKLKGLLAKRTAESKVGNTLEKL